MSPLYGTRVDHPSGYSLELTARGETVIYRDSELEADASVAWTKEGGQYRAHLYASTLRRSDTAEPPLANLAEAVLERMASFLGDNGSSPVTVDRSPPQPIEATMAEYIAKAEATGEWKAERRNDGTWALGRVRPPKHRG
jgi:hypothetical protein